MKRNEWKFGYGADVLLKAAQDKKTFHASRLEFWTAKKSEVLGKVKAEGLEIDESLSNLASNAYRNETVRVRPELLNDMREVIAKVNEHRDLIKDYDSWVQTFASQGKANLDLDHEDWMFFFGK